ncbi:MAG: NAD(P)-binding protein, partial [Chloroflexota bacterium]
MDFDAIVIGSGFGGSVAAFRLSQSRAGIIPSEKGYRVAVVEMGRRVSRVDMEKANQYPDRLSGGQQQR